MHVLAGSTPCSATLTLNTLVQCRCVQGTLWEWYRTLQAQGWRLDANSYSTAFR